MKGGKAAENRDCIYYEYRHMPEGRQGVKERDARKRANQIKGGAPRRKDPRV